MVKDFEKKCAMRANIVSDSVPSELVEPNFNTCVMRQESLKGSRATNLGCGTHMWDADVGWVR